MIRPSHTHSDLLSLNDSLDRAWLKDWISAGIGDAPPIEAVDVHFVRPKRGRSMLLGVSITWGGQEQPLTTLAGIYAALEHTNHAASKAGTLRQVNPPVGPTMDMLRHPHALFLAFPNDRVLRGLSAAADVRRLGNRLQREPFPWSAPGVRIRARQSSVTPVRWKVGRRAVLHAALSVRDSVENTTRTEDVFVRVYPKEQLGQQLSRWQTVSRLIPDVMPCRVHGCDSERSFLVIEGQKGEAVRDVREGVELATQAISRVHATGISGARALPVGNDEGSLLAALRPLDDLVEWLPEWASRISKVRSWLTRSRPQAGCGAPRIVHGDLKVDQLLTSAEGNYLLDWDEAALGDPHADYASLAADAVLHYGFTDAVDHVEQKAAAVLGSAFDAPRWRWQLSIAFARRALEGLQRGRPNWRETGHHALRWAGPQTRSPGRRTIAALAEPLHALLDRGRRASLVGVADGYIALTAVWPDRNGFVAGLRAQNEDFWLRVNGSVEVLRGVNDSELPAIHKLVQHAGYRLVSRRPGRRATLVPRSSGDHFVHIRRPARAAAALRHALRVQDLLDSARIRTAPIVGMLCDRSGWITRRVPGAPIQMSIGMGCWSALGETLAAVHGVRASGGLPSRTRAAALEAARRQVELTAHVDDPLARWLDETLASLALVPCTSPERSEVLVHGDLHPGQIIASSSIVIIDWERAGLGEAEEDLGNLAAHLYWRADTHARTTWAAVRAAYVQRGGSIREDVLRFHAQLSLLRVLAVHSWRDVDRKRCVGLHDAWQRWSEELKQW